MKTKPSTSRTRGVFPMRPPDSGWFAIVNDEYGKPRRLGVFRTKREAQTVMACCLVEMIARDLDALPFQGERTLSHALALRALNEAMENCQRGKAER